MNKTKIYYALLLVTSMLWAANFVAGKWVVNDASAITLIVLRWAVSAIVLLPFVWVREKRLLPPKQAWLALIGMGATGVVLFNYFMFLALEHTTAVNVGLLSALNPVSIALVSALWLRERLLPKQLAGMAVSLLGVLVVLSDGDPSAIAGIRFNIGDVYMIIAVLTWGIYSVISKRAMETMSPYSSTMWSGIIGTIMMLPLLSTHWRIASGVSASFWLGALYMAIGGTVLAMVFWNIGVKRIGGTHSGMFLNFNPIFTAIFAYITLGERMGMPQWIGTALVISGVYVFSAKRRSTATA
jgi:drug/metabolite transporter (DMT)-like permease